MVDNMRKKRDKVWVGWGGVVEDIGKGGRKGWEGGGGWRLEKDKLMGEKMIGDMLGRMKVGMNEKMK